MIYTYGYLFYLPITLFFLLIFIIIGKKNRQSYPFYICAFIALLFINIAINISIFPILIEDIPEFDISYNINWNILNFGSGWRHNFLNILLTFPIGFGMQFIVNTSFAKRIIVSVLCGMSFEICQLIILYTLKPINIFFDVNDLISNIVGAFLGVLFIQLINLIIKKTKKRKYPPIIAYLDEVCRTS